MLGVALALVFVLQTQAQAPARGQGPTVGDTIWITRTVRVAPRQTVRPGAWQPPDPIEAAGPPRVTVQGTTVEIAYPVTIWRAGEHRVEIPGPLLLGPGNAADSLPSYDTTLVIRSVLPAAPPGAPVAPQPRAEFVPRRLVSPWPMVVLWIATAILLLPLHWWWRRRGKSVRPAVPAPPASGALEVPVERWADAGERRTVASLSVARLRAAIAGAPDGNQIDDELRGLLATLDRARFGARTDEDALTLFRRAVQAAERVGRYTLGPPLEPPPLGQQPLGEPPHEKSSAGGSA
jgi:hypothetical protein